MRWRLLEGPRRRRSSQRPPGYPPSLADLAAFSFTPSTSRVVPVAPSFPPSLADLAVHFFTYFDAAPCLCGSLFAPSPPSAPLSVPVASLPPSLADLAALSFTPSTSQIVPAALISLLRGLTSVIYPFAPSASDFFLLFSTVVIISTAPSNLSPSSAPDFLPIFFPTLRIVSATIFLPDFFCQISFPGFDRRSFSSPF